MGIKIEVYRKKPLSIGGVQFDGKNGKEIAAWVNSYGEKLATARGSYISIVTLEGVFKVKKGDRVVQGVKGEFYSIKPEVFDVSYDIVKPTVRKRKDYARA